MTTLCIEDYRRDIRAEYGSDDLTDIEQMLMFWRHEATRDVALDMADRHCAASGHIPLNHQEERDERAG